MDLYERVRHGLAEELGVDPGDELRAAHEDLLAIGSEPLARRTTVPRASEERHQPGRSCRLRVRGFTARPEAQRCWTTSRTGAKPARS